MIINLSGKIEDKMLNSLLEGLNNDGYVKILFSSTGGWVSVMEAMLHVLEEEKDRVELVGYGDLSSAAFVLFFEATCTRTLLSSTTGLAHLQAMKVDMTQAGNCRFENQQWNLVEMNKEKEDWIERHKLIGLNDRELKRMRKGEDILFTYSRMAELLLSPGPADLNAMSAQSPPEIV